MDQETYPNNPDSQMLRELDKHNSGDNLPVGESNEPQSIDAQQDAEQDNGGQDQSERSDVPVVEPIIIDGKEFNSEREAYEYSQKKLQEAETERLILLAKQEAYQDAMGQRQQVQQPVEQVVEEDDSDEFYADPQGYLKKKTQSIEDQVRQKLRQELDAEREDQRLWKEFFDSHPDLDGFKGDCEQVLSANLDTIKMLAAKDRKKAMDYLATKTREKFQTYMERMKPRKELHRTNAGPSIGANPTPSVTPQQKDDEPLDFTAQMRSLRK